MSQPVILVVEDNPDEAQLLREAFAEIAPGVVIVAAACAGEALAYLSGLGAGDWPCALVTDGDLPDLSGVQLIARIRADPRTQAMVMVMLSGGMSAPPGLGEVDWHEKPLTWPGWCAWVGRLVSRLPQPGHAAEGASEH